MTEEPEKVFKLALALSGAISAGAYTAGVLDYFFQALDQWEKARGKPGTPQHRVIVQAISGASAGAITGALGAVALARGMRREALTEAEK
ncbi:MAG TPA: patatin-like phospholipase family protein, partial [Acetobacteraceae bacterium]|nr:patatin-like phospholipase family protein [Acetobacteraceae bacterium]